MLLWPAGQSVAKKLPLPAGANVMAFLDDGPLVGALYKSEFTELPTPAGADVPPALTSLGAGEQVNANGGVVATGYAVHDGGGAQLTVPKGQKASAVAVSDDNLVVGPAVSASGTALGPRSRRC